MFNLATRYLANLFMPFEWAVVAAFPVGLTVAFAMNKRLVFKTATQPIRFQYARFLLVNLLGLVQVWSVSVTLLRFVFLPLGMSWHPDLIAHFFGLATLTVTSYWAHRVYSFK